MTPQPDEDAWALRRAEMLRAIAAALGLPAAAFFGSDGDPPEAKTQACELLTTFNAIRDPEARARCLAFVRATAGPDLGGSER